MPTWKDKVLEDTPDSKGKEEDASAAMQSHIEEVRIWRANGRAYIAGVFGEPRNKALVVEISERMSSNHVKLMETIAEQLGVGWCTQK